MPHIIGGYFGNGSFLIKNLGQFLLRMADWTDFLVSGGHDTAEYKVQAMRAVGIRVTDSPAALGEEMLKAMKG
mgnify:CR=1 FL=1